MKTLPILKSVVIILLLCSSLVSNAQTKKLFFIPEIKYDKAILSGKITGMIPNDSVFKPIYLSFTNVVTADNVNYEIPIKTDGTFSYSIPVQCISFPALQSEYYENIVCLLPGEETRLEISYDSVQNKHVKLSNSLNLSADDAMNIQGVVEDAITQVQTGSNEIVSPEIFSQRSIIALSNSLKFIDNTNKLSGVAKQIATSELKAWWLTTYLFDYATWINICIKNQPKTDSDSKEFHPQIPGRSYYSFLKTLYMYDPANFSASFYSNFLQLLLNNDTLAIPDIGDMPVNTWLKKVKEILKDDIGTDTGLFYDLLAGNAFAKQLIEMEPLSEIQQKNLQSYFSNKSFVDILLDENEKVKELVQKSNKAKIFEFTETTNKVMDTIKAKYHGKVIFVDFWTTWCGPCLAAMRESESVQKEFENKDVVFVDITNPTSPRKTWEQKLLKIGGEHYYVTVDDWNFIQKVYKFQGIPHYLILDKNGILKYNQGGFMGNENMRKWIKESL